MKCILTILMLFAGLKPCLGQYTGGQNDGYAMASYTEGNVSNENLPTRAALIYSDEAILLDCTELQEGTLLRVLNLQGLPVQELILSGHPDWIRLQPAKNSSQQVYLLHISTGNASWVQKFLW